MLTSEAADQNVEGEKGEVIHSSSDPLPQASINPHSAMVGIWNNIIANLIFLIQKGFIGTRISWMKHTSESVFGWVDVGCV
jgi:hypothetical protein